jgi:diguanylate cyclase (GGDEF)-like protein/PAS domain S-box-containing protein
MSDSDGRYRLNEQVTERSGPAGARSIDLLIVEDSEADTELLLWELKKGGYAPIHERVETVESLKAALKKKRWDLIVSDYTMPHLKGTDALALVRGAGYRVPFIFFSGTLGEDMAVAAVKAGANDYIVKTNLKRLIPAIDRELREAEVDRKRERAEEALRESSQKLQGVIQSSPVAIIVIDPAGNVEMWNPAAEQIFGWSEKEIVGQPLPIIPEERRKSFDENRRKVLQGENLVALELRHRRKDGSIVDTSLSTSLLHNEQGEVSGIMGVIADMTERNRSLATIHHMAYHDMLTGLPNRTVLRDRLQQAILAHSHGEKSAALLLIDLDHFREINDTLGHHRGDILLQQIGPRLLPVLKEPAIIARLGGDEFGVLLPRVNESEALLVAGEIQKEMEKPFMIESIPVILGASIGIALSPDHGENPDGLIQRADVAMYVAKENESGCQVYSSEIDKHSPRRLGLLGELRHAIDNNQLFLVYQPKIHLLTSRIKGVEALVRWLHPQYGIIPPDQFISIAEHSGLIKPLTLWVIKAALHQSSLWHKEGKILNVAVNLSARNLEDPHLPDQIVKLLHDAGVVPSSLELEITESALMVNPTHAMATLTALSKIGIQLSIDDFGIGYSSLGYLKRLPVNQIKIDKSFIKEMATDKDDAMIVRSTIELTHNLGLKVVAEGVESREVLERLVGLRCDEAQGYFISPPLPVSGLKSWFSETAPQRGWTLC